MVLRTRLVIGAALLFVPVQALAVTGEDIAKKARDTSAVGYVGQKSDSVMKLFDEKGAEVVAYKLNTITLEASAENQNTTMSLIRFEAPSDTKGTALLTHEKKGGDEARWLFLSETRQVKQIAGSAKSSSFKGSEFAYEDLAVDTFEKFDYKLTGEKDVGGAATYVVESTPKYQDSGYSKIVNYYDKKNYYVVRTDFYDKAGKLLKVGTFGKWKDYDGKWRAHAGQMENVQTKRKTIVAAGNFKLGIKLSDRLFTVNQLQKQ